MMGENMAPPDAHVEQVHKFGNEQRTAVEILTKMKEDRLPNYLLAQGLGTFVAYQDLVDSGSDDPHKLRAYQELAEEGADRVTRELGNCGVTGVTRDQLALLQAELENHCKEVTGRDWPQK